MTLTIVFVRLDGDSAAIIDGQQLVSLLFQVNMTTTIYPCQRQPTTNVHKTNQDLGLCTYKLLPVHIMLRSSAVYCMSPVSDEGDYGALRLSCAHYVPIVLDRMSYVLLFACVIGLQRYDNNIYKVLAAGRLFSNTNKKNKELKIKK